MHPVLYVLREVAANLVMGNPAMRKWRLARPRTSTRFSGSAAELERSAFLGLRIVRDRVGSVRGMDVLEIGPGDHLASGLALLAAGAASYTAVDRFPGDYSGSGAKAWYRGVRERWPAVFPEWPWPEWLDPGAFPEAYPERVRVHREGVEEAAVERRYDLICSFQVAEHVSDLARFATMQRELLRPGGVAVHRVDFGPHGWGAFPDRLLFLRFPDWLWTLMGSNRGAPNRRRFHELKGLLEEAGLEVSVVDVERTDAPVVRERLAPRFREMPEESLRVEAAVFVCRPRGAGGETPAAAALGAARSGS